MFCHLILVSSANLIQLQVYVTTKQGYWYCELFIIIISGSGRELLNIRKLIHRYTFITDKIFKLVFSRIQSFCRPCSYECWQICVYTYTFDCVEKIHISPDLATSDHCLILCCQKRSRLWEMSSGTETDTGTGQNNNNSWGFYLFPYTVVVTSQLFILSTQKKKQKINVTWSFGSWSCL